MSIRKRGRPPKSPPQIINEPESDPNKFTRIIEYNDGVVVTWVYNLKTFNKGPIQINIEYPSKYTTLEDEQDVLPVTQRKYLNPNNGKWIGYSRAKQLGLID